jgi:hypothetical protein
MVRPSIAPKAHKGNLRIWRSFSFRFGISNDSTDVPLNDHVLWMSFGMKNGLSRNFH